jgi:hypothetical protein
VEIPFVATRRKTGMRAGNAGSPHDLRAPAELLSKDGPAVARPAFSTTEKKPTQFFRDAVDSAPRHP